MKNNIGIDIGGTKMYMLANSKTGYIEKKVSTGKDCSKEKIKKEIDEFIKTLPFIVDGIGIAIPGLVKGDNEVICAEISSLNGVKSEYFNVEDANKRIKIRLINDVKAANVCEINNNKESDTLAVIMVGTGIATSIYTKGKIITGSNGFAGELGYCVLKENDEIRTIDSLCGGLAILEKANCNIEEFLNKINEGDKESIELLKRAGDNFGIAIINVLHLFNPDTIVVSGTTSTYPYYMEAALETAKKYAIPDIFKVCTIKKAKDNKRIVALGAMEYVESNIMLL